MTITEPEAPAVRRTPKGLLIGGLLVVFVIAGFISGFASSAPDGLEKVAGDEGFGETARDHAFSGFFLADYAVRGIDNERLAGGLAGVIGVIVTLAVGTLLFLGMSRMGRKTGDPT